MSPRNLWIALAGGAVVLLVAVATLYFLAPSDRGPTAAMVAARRVPGELPVLWHVPAFSFVDQSGARTTDRDLLGHTWIADFIYTECTTVCPFISAKMVLLQRQIEDPSVRFVSFSVDPEHDTPAVLAAYRAGWNAGDERWRLLSTTPEGLEALARGMHVTVQRTADPSNPIVHTNLFVLVDADGEVRQVYDSNDDEALAQLVRDVRRLSGAASTPVARADTSGEELYSSLGCAACHEQGRLAPPLGGVAGSTIVLDDGTTVTADEAYLRESIVAPGKKLVQGYPGLMPGYGGYLSDEQIGRLVAHVRSLPPGGARSRQAATMAVDPVCGMKIRVEADTPHATYEGHEYRFCSDHCRAAFIADPAKYATP